MTEQNTWEEIEQGLQMPFPGSHIKWRLQTTPKDAKEPQGLAVAYLDPRDIHQRFDDMCGGGSWSFDWQPIIVEGGKVLAAKGIISIAGISKADVGTSKASEEEATKSAVTDALKRAAVLWGVGRHIYRMQAQWVACVMKRNKWEIDPKEKERLRGLAK